MHLSRAPGAESYEISLNGIDYTGLLMLHLSSAIEKYRSMIPKLDVYDMFKKIAECRSTLCAVFNFDVLFWVHTYRVIYFKKIMCSLVDLYVWPIIVIYVPLCCV